MNTSLRLHTQRGALLSPNFLTPNHRQQSGGLVSPAQSSLEQPPPPPASSPSGQPQPPSPAYSGPPPAPPPQLPPRKSRAGCVIAIALGLIVLCCVAPVVGGIAFFSLTDIGREIVPTLEAIVTEAAEPSAAEGRPTPRGTPLIDVLGGNGRATATPRGVLDFDADASSDAAPQDFVGDWEVVAAQDADGPRDDVIGDQMRLMLAEDGETILSVGLPYDASTEPDMSLRVVGGRTAAGEVINADPPIQVAITLSDDGQELDMTLRMEPADAPAEEVSLTFARIGNGTQR